MAALGAEGFAELVDESLDRKLAVACLAALVLRETEDAASVSTPRRRRRPRRSSRSCLREDAVDQLLEVAGCGLDVAGHDPEEVVALDAVADADVIVRDRQDEVVRLLIMESVEREPSPYRRRVP